MGADTAGDLAELLRMYGEDEQPILGDPYAHGFDGTAAVVEALRLLGVLEPKIDQMNEQPGDHKGLKLACEPILKAATLITPG